MAETEEELRKAFLWETLPWEDLIVFPVFDPITRDVMEMLVGMMERWIDP